MKPLLTIFLIGVSCFLFSCAWRTRDDDVQKYNNRGAAYLQQGKLDEAIVAYKKVIRLNPNSAEAHNSLGIAYLEGGKLEEAVAAFKMAIHINPNFVEAYYRLADAYSLKNEKMLSRESLQKAMTLEGSYIMDASPERWGIRSLPN